MKKGYVLILLVLIGLLFYWFQVRPSQIRKKCYEIVKAKSRKLLEHNLVYRSCLVENGMKAEDIFPNK